MVIPAFYLNMRRRAEEQIHVLSYCRCVVAQYGRLPKSGSALYNYKYLLLVNEYITVFFLVTFIKLKHTYAFFFNSIPRQQIPSNVTHWAFNCPSETFRVVPSAVFFPLTLNFYFCTSTHEFFGLKPLSLN